MIGTVGAKEVHGMGVHRLDRPTTASATKETICRKDKDSRSPSSTLGRSLARTIYIPWASSSPHLLSSSSRFLMASSCASRAFTCCSSICFSCSFVSVGAKGIAKGVAGAVGAPEVGGTPVGGAVGVVV